ncbi:hypothetical protein [Pseudomonas syringae group genomosp. 3]|uniref:hypothetical protein n=1 Tax=Pseudomonas syringae group genomosp. 3 TaxID=251701 RepID=UPI000EFECC87|nr:hypothetical protein [Pseudomonas syringae group genomosp. 3]
MKNNKYSAPANTAHAEAAAVKMRVSFEYLDLSSQHFFVHGLEAEHYQKLFDCFHTLAEATEEQITKQNHPSLTAKSIFNTGTGSFSRFPVDVENRISEKLKGEKRSLNLMGNNSTKPKVLSEEEITALAAKEARQIVGQAFEVRIGKSYGRLHGIVWNKAFHVVWIDPAHNLYPSKDYGVRLHREYATVPGYGPDAVAQVKHENRALTDEYNALQLEHETLNEEFAEYVCPKCSTSHD